MDRHAGIARERNSAISMSEGSPEPYDDQPVLTVEVADVDAISNRALAG